MKPMMVQLFLLKSKHEILKIKSRYNKTPRRGKVTFYTGSFIGNLVLDGKGR
jgi:hypothetical protein